LTALWRVTTEAFGVSHVQLMHKPWDALLEDYARFTAIEAANALGRDQEAAIRTKLFDGAFALGDELRTRTRLRSLKDALALAQILYKAIGIELHAAEDGTLTVSRCYFSAYYSRDTCRLISALDQGILAGLTGGRHLEFHERITEGAPCCRAELKSRRVHR
jgi:hypothetical protein